MVVRGKRLSLLAASCPRVRVPCVWPRVQGESRHLIVECLHYRVVGFCNAEIFVVVRGKILFLLAASCPRVRAPCGWPGVRVGLDTYRVVGFYNVEISVVVRDMTLFLLAASCPRVMVPCGWPGVRGESQHFLKFRIDYQRGFQFDYRFKIDFFSSYI